MKVDKTQTMSETERKWFERGKKEGRDETIAKIKEELEYDIEDNPPGVGHYSDGVRIAAKAYLRFINKLRKNKGSV